MARNVAIGIQNFEDMVQKNYFYVDKTSFIKEWWDSGDAVTLITRPRRFGKTLNISMVERFFSNKYAGKGELFRGLSVWEHEEYREIQGTYPVIILLDEYDTPMQEAYVDGYWDEMVYFTRSMFNAAFKTNPWLERGIMTGITRVSKESIFSDLNNLEVVTTTSDQYATSFGFTEREVFDALDEFGLGQEKENVKKWYDGFTFGSHEDIYNPWSILNFIDKRKFTTYWANTSSNSLVGKLIREGSRSIKEKFEGLLRGETITSQIDEQIVYNQLNGNERAIWSLLLASGYLKVLSYEDYRDIPEGAEPEYELTLTNREVKLMFQRMVRDWFSEAEADYNDFVKALLAGDVKAMNAYMNRVALQTFSYFRKGDEFHTSITMYGTVILVRELPEKSRNGFTMVSCWG